MADKTFKIIYNLEGLSDAEVAEYARNVSSYFGLDPDMNWFDVLWMVDSDTGLRRRQLYARRGTTDVLREKRGISITKMEFHSGPGFVAYTASGVDAKGRQEMAVGSHSIEGLTGEKLAAAVSTAETRAGRRLTLKFCGLGILDYTEVSDPVELKISAPNLELAPNAIPPAFAPPPPVAATVSSAPIVPPQEDAVAQAQAEAAEVGRLALKALAAAQTAPPANTAAPQPTLAAPQAVEAPSAQENPPAEPRKRRTRKPANTVDISSPGQTSEAPKPALPREGGTVGTGTLEIPPLVEKSVSPVEKPQSEGLVQPLETYEAFQARMKAEYDRAQASLKVQAAPVVPPQAVPAVPAQANPAPVLPLAAPTPPSFPGKPTEEQQNHYREVFREYSNQILPIDGGMVPSVGIGGSSVKLRLFFERYIGKPTQEATAEEWEGFIQFIKSFVERNTAKGFVKYINDSIGAK